MSVSITYKTIRQMHNLANSLISYTKVKICLTRFEDGCFNDETNHT